MSCLSRIINWGIIPELVKDNVYNSFNVHLIDNMTHIGLVISFNQIGNWYFMLSLFSNYNILKDNIKSIENYIKRGNL